MNDTYDKLFASAFDLVCTLAGHDPNRVGISEYDIDPLVAKAKVIADRAYNELIKAKSVL